MNDSLIPVELRARILMLSGSTLTETQRALADDAYRRNPVAFERALGMAESSPRPTAYFISSIKRICIEEMARPVAAARRHDLDPVDCRDCADTGFVILIRDVGPEARAGDAAPCHCSAGQKKQARYGTIHYGRDDYRPVAHDSAGITLIEYAESDAGKADPHLPAFLKAMRVGSRNDESSAG